MITDPATAALGIFTATVVFQAGMYFAQFRSLKKDMKKLVTQEGLELELLKRDQQHSAMYQTIDNCKWVHSQEKVNGGKAKHHTAGD